LATLVQSLGIQISTLLNGDTLYHLIAMAAYVFYYFGVVQVIELEQKVL